MQVLNKRLKKPIKLLIGKSLVGSDDWVKNSKDEIVNVHQTLTFITFGEFKDQLKRVRSMGFVLAEILDYGEVNKEEVKEVFNSVYKIEKLSNESAEDIKKENQFLKEQLQALNKKIDALSNDSVEDIVEETTEDSENDNTNLPDDKEELCKLLDEKGIEYKKSQGINTLKELLTKG